MIAIVFILCASLSFSSTEAPTPFSSLATIVKDSQSEVAYFLCARRMTTKAGNETCLVTTNTIPLVTAPLITGSPIVLSKISPFPRSILFFECDAREVIHYIESLHDRRFSKVVIIIHGLTDTETGFMKKIFLKCWESGIIQVGIIPLSESVGLSSANIFTYFPFQEGKCFDTSPLFLGALGDQSLTANMFASNKSNNLRGCTVTVAVGSQVLSTQHVPKYIHKDPAVVYLDWVSRSMNFIPKMQTSKDSNPLAGPSTGETHMAAVLAINYPGVPYDSPSAPIMECKTFCLPVGYVQSHPWKLVVEEFTPNVWYGLLFSSCVFGIAFHMVSKHSSLYDSSIPNDNIWQSIFMSIVTFVAPMSYNTDNVKLRSLLAMWLIVTLVVATAYSSRLSSLSTAPDIEKFKNLEEVMFSEIPVIARSGYKPFFDEWKFTESTKKIEFYEMMRWVSFMNRITATTGRSEKLAYFTNRGLCTATPGWYVLKDSCTAVMNVHLITLPKSSPMTSSVERAGNYAVQGMSYKWRPYIERKTGQIQASEVSAHVKVLASGWIIATVSFIIELLSKYSISDAFIKSKKIFHK